MKIKKSMEIKKSTPLSRFIMITFFAGVTILGLVLVKVLFGIQ